MCKVLSRWRSQNFLVCAQRNSAEELDRGNREAAFLALLISELRACAGTMNSRPRKARPDLRRKLVEPRGFEDIICSGHAFVIDGGNFAGGNKIYRPKRCRTDSSVSWLLQLILLRLCKASLGTRLGTRLLRNAICSSLAVFNFFVTS